MLRNLFDRIIFNGYEAADAESSARVVARYSRGNTMVQLRRYLNHRKMEKLRADGDRAAERLAKRAKRFKL